MLTLRPACLGDAEILFRWRNDPHTRAASIDPEEIQWKAHLAWFTESLGNPRRKLFIAECNGEAVGTVRLDLGDEAELSWTVAPDHRGRGLGKQMVALACPPGPVIAHIKRDNLASQRIAQAAGFGLACDGPLQRWFRSA